MPKDPIRHKQIVELTRERMKGNVYGKGVKQSKETRNLRSERFNGVKNPMFGKHHSAEARIKMSNAPKCKGEKHYAWKGGTEKWWQHHVKQRDNFTCQRCGLQDYSNGFMDADHIKSKKRYPELKFELTNGQTLCPNCHRRKSIENNDIHPIH